MRAIALALLFYCAHARAQDSEADAPSVTYREVRPPAGSGRRGLIVVPRWAPWVAGAALAAAAGWVLLRQARGSNE